MYSIYPINLYVDGLPSLCLSYCSLLLYAFLFSSCPWVFCQSCVTLPPAKTTWCRPEGAPWPLLITLRWLALVPLLIFTNAHWHGPLKPWGAAWTWDRPNKSNLILGWCVQACLRPPRQWTRTAGAPFATSVCTLEWTCMLFMGELDMWKIWWENVLLHVALYRW